MTFRTCARLARSAAYSWKRPVRELATTISPWTNTSAAARLPPGAVAVMCAWPYDAVDTVPSSATATTCGLSEVQVTPVAGPMMTPASSAKFAFSGYRRLSGRPSRAAVSFDGLVHQDVDGLRLQQPDNVERCSAGSHRRNDAREAHPRDARVRGGPL